MNLNLLFLLMILLRANSLNINCNSPICSECISGYNYENMSCLHICPEGYSLIRASCVQQVKSPFILLKLFRFLDVSANHVSDFQHPDGLPFGDLQRKSPIPTKDRGFYFQNTSSLFSTTNWVLAPTFFVNFLLKVHDEGKIFSCSNGNTTFFEVTYESTEIILSFIGSDKNSSREFTISSKFQAKLWKTLSVSFTLSLFNTTVEINTIKTVFESIEFSPNQELTFYLGNESLGFRGFLQQFEVGNAKFLGFTPIYQEVLCDYNQYFDSLASTCNDCDPGCQTWPWCTRNNSCSICLSQNCEFCTGFDFFDCQSCNSFRPSPYCESIPFCESSNGTECISCIESYTLLGELCVKEPYMYDSNFSSPEIDVRFGYIREKYGGIFKSGSSVSTYGPFNVPERDDPLPASKRGLYFNGSSYLETIENIRINYQFTLAFWINIQDYAFRYLIDSNRFHLTSFFVSFIQLTNIEETRLFIVPQKAGTKSAWNFLTLTVDYANWTQSFTVGNNRDESFIYSISGYAFYDSPGTVKLGYGSGDKGFVGFIYSFSLWQTAIFEEFQDFISSKPADLWNVEFGKFYNYYEKESMNCDSACKSGCNVWGHCNQCVSLNCSFCDNLNETCIEDQNVQCLEGYQYTRGKCCDLTCSDCFGPGYYRCLECIYPFVNLGNMCIASCPSFMFGVKCDSSTSVVISLTFDRAVPQLVDSINNIKFYSKSGSGIWPYPQETDPIPAFKRGYYFDQKSVMYSDPLKISHNFTLVFFMKIIKPGILLTKSNFTVSIERNGTSIQIGDSKRLFIKNFNFETWTILAFQFYHDMDGLLNFQRMYSNKTSAKTSFWSFFIHHDVNSSFIFGNGFNSTQGFIWKFQVFNSIYSPELDSLRLCNYSYESQCLWNMSIENFLIDNKTKPCNETCNYGCKESGSCNYCEDEDCLSCSVEDSECFLCSENSILLNKHCACKQGYIKSNNICTMCPHAYIGFTCFEVCPFGFIINTSSGECLRKSTNKLLISLSFFLSIASNYSDPQSGIICLLNPETSPLPLYQRGLYFGSGNTSISFPPIPNEILLFGPSFSVSFWMLSTLNSSSVFHKTLIQGYLFSGYLLDAYFIFTLFIQDSELSSMSSFPLEQDSWHEVIVNVKFDSKNVFCYLIIDRVLNEENFTSGIVKDEKGGQFEFGSQTDLPGFEGFLYSINFYDNEVTLDDLGKPEFKFSDTPNNTCSASQYLDEVTGNCRDCLQECKYGCRYGYSCSLCADPNCDECEFYEKLVCDKCQNNSVSYNNQCFKCTNFEFFSETIQGCVACPPLCKSCENISSCIDCKPNSALNSNNLCECVQGFTGLSVCEQIYFSAELNIHNTELRVNFTEDLLYDLNNSQIEIYADKEKKEFEITKISQNVFYINSMAQYLKKSQISLYFLGKIYSVRYSLLQTSFLESQIEPQFQNTIVKAIVEIKNSIKYIYVSTIGLAIGTSVLNFDPNCLFTFLNSAELIAFTSTFDLDMDNNLVDFLNNLKISSSLPSFFYKISSESVNIDNKKLIGYGYSSNILLDNSGFIISFFFTLVLMNFLVFVLSKILRGCCKIYILRLLKYFKFEFYLRWWIQTLFELMLTSFISLKFFDPDLQFQIGNLIITIVIWVRAIQSIHIFLFMLLCFVVNRRSKLINNHEIQELVEKFGVFFDEFSSGKWYRYLFYVIFFVRRLVLCTFVVFSANAAFQVILSLFFSIAVLLYTRLSSCFKDHFFDKYFFACEMLIGVFYLFQGLFALNFISSSTLTVTGYSIVFIILFITIIYGTTSSIIKIWKTCKKSKRSIKVIPSKYIERENSQDQINSFYGLNSTHNPKTDLSNHFGSGAGESVPMRNLSIKFGPHVTLRDSPLSSMHIH